jgi:hypothetical protein
MLATADELRTLLKQDETALPDATAELLLKLATGAVRGAVGQTLTLVENDTITLMGTRDRWLNLPQRPVAAVTAVSLDGEAVTDYKRFGARLWRRDRWAPRCDEPSEVSVTYTHGYQDWDDKLVPAKGPALTVAAKLSENLLGATGMSIDDFSLQFGQSSGEQFAQVGG